MATSNKIRVGIVGVSPNRGFASIAHIPALQALPEFEITAVCTTRQDSADVAAKHFAFPRAANLQQQIRVTIARAAAAWVKV
jgi:predicted dehydrogenase